jgi:hypothetical protein
MVHFPFDGDNWHWHATLAEAMNSFILEEKRRDLLNAYFLGKKSLYFLQIIGLKGLSERNLVNFMVNTTNRFESYE